MCGIWARGSQASVVGGCLAWELQDVQPKALGPDCHPHKIALQPPESCRLFLGVQFLLDCLSFEQMVWRACDSFWGEMTGEVIYPGVWHIPWRCQAF